MTVKSLLKKHQGQTVHCLFNNGNCGDGVIHKSARLLFEKYNVPILGFRRNEEKSGDVLFMFGCGAMCEKHDAMIYALDDNLYRFNTIYVLPSTLDTDFKPTAKLIKKLDERVFIFAREKESYDRVRAILRFPKNVWLDHDLAMHFDYTPYKQKGSGTLVCFRTDEPFLEFVPSSLIQENRDISIQKKEAEYDWFLKKIAAYQTVHTNRAHVAIASAKLGRQTYVYPGANYKLRAMYEYSLAKYPNTRWVDKFNRIYHDQRIGVSQ